MQLCRAGLFLSLYILCLLRVTGHIFLGGINITYGPMLFQTDMIA